MYLECILEYRILRFQFKVYKYSTVHSTRIKSNSINSINSTIRNRLLLQLFISEMIHAKQWHYSLQRLPVASFYILHEEIQGILPVLILHSEDKELFDSFYIQKARRSSIQSTRPSTGIPVLQGHSSHS